VLDKINEVLEPHLFPKTPEDPEPRRCKVCGTGLLALKTSRNGSAFIGCSNYPECRYTRPLAGGDEGDAALDGKILGTGTPGGEVFDEEAEAQPVTLHKGPYGYYVQLGEPVDGAKPPRSSIPKGMDPATLTLERALDLLSLPRTIGRHPEDGEPVEAGIGRFGPFVRHGSTYANIAEAEEVFTIGMNRAVELLAQKAQRAGRGRGAAVQPLRELGAHPDGGSVAVYEGRYGPYVKWEKVNATLPKEMAPEAVTLEQALELIAAKPAGKKRPAPRKKATPKPAKAKAAKPKPAKAKAASRPPAAE